MPIVDVVTQIQNIPIVLMPVILVHLKQFFFQKNMFYGGVIYIFRLCNYIVFPIVCFRNNYALFLVFLSISVKGQSNPQLFEIRGEVNLSVGTIVMIPFAPDQFYPHKIEPLESEIRDGLFHFSGKLYYPYPFFIQIRNDLGHLLYISQMFIIDPGTQIVRCDINARREVPYIDNKSAMDKAEKLDNENDRVDKIYAEFISRKRKFYQKEKEKISPELHLRYREQEKDILAKKDTLLMKFVQKYPDSYIGLWELVCRIHPGYSSIYDSIYSTFSSKIKNTITAKMLREKLSGASSVRIGKQFPFIYLLDTSGNNKTLNITLGSKYTLIDFWFSDCYPCIEQFPEMKNLFHKYGDKFQIVGISIDGLPRIDNWKETIIKLQLTWAQYLDLNGEHAGKLAINSFPTNFLLDNMGRILYINLDMVDLKWFLKSLKP